MSLLFAPITLRGATFRNRLPSASRIRESSGLPVGAVGLITEPRQAEKTLEDGRADVVLLDRELLRNPRWPQAAAAELGADIPWPEQFARARL